MKKFYNLLFVLAVPAIFIIFTSEVLFHTGSPGGKSGSPGDNGNNCTDCHAGTPVNEELWIYSTDLLLSGYEPNETYNVFVVGVDSDANKFGFEATAEDASGNKVGNFVADVTGFTQVLNSGKSITHTALGSNPIADTGTLWFFTWVAPPSNVGDVTFYTAVNAANGNGNNSGDQVHLSQFTASPLNVGIAKQKDASFNIYPNPSDGEVTIQLQSSERVEVDIMNLNGQIVRKDFASGQQRKIDLSELQPGVYLIRIENQIQRLIIR